MSFAALEVLLSNHTMIRSVRSMSVWRRVLVSAVLAVAMLSFWLVSAPSAYAVFATAPTFSAPTRVAGATETWTVGAFVSGATTNLTSATVVFPAGFTVPAAPTVTVTGSSAACTVTGGTGTTTGTGPFSIAIAISGVCNAAGATGTNSITIAGITNPQLAGSKAAAGFTLTTSNDVATAASAAVIIAHAAVDHLEATAPATQVAGVSFTLAALRAVDAFGNLANGANGATAFTSAGRTVAYTLSGTSNGPTSGTDTFTTTVSFTAGLSTTTLTTTLHRAQSTTITANDSVLAGTDVASAAFVVQHAAANRLEATAPATQVAGVSFTLAALRAVDAFGNLANGANGATAFTSAGRTVAYTLSGTSNGPTSGTDTFTTTVSFTAGLSTTTLTTTLHRAQSTTITANDSVLAGTDVASAAFTVNAAAANLLAITQQPTAAVAGATISPAMTVAIRDAFGNPRSSDTANVTVAIGTNPSAGVIGGTTTRAAVAGVATFNDNTISAAGTGYTLVFTSAGLTGATSGAFNITAAATPPAPEQPAPPAPTPAAEAPREVVALGTVEKVVTSATAATAVTATSASGSTAEVTVPAGALPAGTTVQVASVATVSALTAAAPPPVGASILAGFQINATAANGTAVAGNFAAPVTVKFGLPAASIPAGTVAGNLVLAFWNGTTWTTVPATVVINANGSATVTASLTHFTVFSVQTRPASAFSPAPVAGLTITTWSGGDLTALATALTGSKSAWVFVGGQAIGYVVGAPAFVNADFVARYPTGAAAGTFMVVVR